MLGVRRTQITSRLPKKRQKNSTPLRAGVAFSKVVTGESSASNTPNTASTNQTNTDNNTSSASISSTTTAAEQQLNTNNKNRRSRNTAPLLNTHNLSQANFPAIANVNEESLDRILAKLKRAVALIEKLNSFTTSSMPDQITNLVNALIGGLTNLSTNTQ